MGLAELRKRDKRAAYSMEYADVIIEQAPVLYDGRCKVLRFLADLKSFKARRRDGTDVALRYDRHIQEFVVDVSERVIGCRYMSLTGDKLPVTQEIVFAEQKGGHRVRLELTCPLFYDFQEFTSAVVAAWGRCRASGEAIFIDNSRRFHVGGERFGAEHGRPHDSWWKRTFGAA